VAISVNRSDLVAMARSFESEIATLVRFTNMEKNSTSAMSREESVALVEWRHPDVSLVAQTNLLGVSQVSLYYQPVAPSPEEVTLKHCTDALYTQYPFNCSRRITAMLGGEGIALNRKAVQRYMREMDIAGISAGPTASKRCLEHHVYPYLLQHTTRAYSKHVWALCVETIGWAPAIVVEASLSNSVVKCISTLNAATDERYASNFGTSN